MDPFSRSLFPSSCPCLLTRSICPSFPLALWVVFSFSLSLYLLSTSLSLSRSLSRSLTVSHALSLSLNHQDSTSIQLSVSHRCASCQSLRGDCFSFTLLPQNPEHWNPKTLTKKKTPKTPDSMATRTSQEYPVPKDSSYLLLGALTLKNPKPQIPKPTALNLRFPLSPPPPRQEAGDSFLDLAGPCSPARGAWGSF